MSRHIILASQSPQRKILMDALGVDFEAVPADINEQGIRDKDLKIQAHKIARAKAEAVLSKNPNLIVVAADTFIVQNNQTLEKPKDKQEAKQMLVQQSGQKLLEYTGFCYLDPLKKIDHASTAVTKLVFRELSSSEIDHYVATQPVTTWSAAFCPAYPEGAVLIDSIAGSFTGFTHGLPINILVPLLKKSGVIG